MAKIREIKANKTSIKLRSRVAAYARVSRDTELLLHSLNAQVSHYSKLIQNNPEWVYAGVFIDEGISGTSRVKRSGFNELIQKCKAGEVDIILTKSISRFARNTVDLLETIRELKGIGVEVRFEREGISTFSGDGEVMLSILAAFAQAESESVSQNLKWAVRKGFENGRPHAASRTFGYKWDGKQYRIVKEEAESVRYIFEEYLKDKSPNQLAKELKEKGAVGMNGVPLTRASIKDIIINEIYVGDLLFQKTYCKSMRKKVLNKGELAQYLVQDAHEAIITRELFEAVQNEKRIRASKAMNLNKEITCFSGKVVCGECGYKCSRRTLSNKKSIAREYYKKWCCNAKETKGKKFCDLKILYEDELRQMSASVLGMEKLNESEFNKQIEKITLYQDRIKFEFKEGGKAVWQDR